MPELDVNEMTFRQKQDLKKGLQKSPSLTGKDKVIHDAIVYERDAYKADLEDAQVKLKDFSEDLEKLKKDLEESQAAYQDLQAKMNEVTGINEKLTDENAQLQNKLTEATIEIEKLNAGTEGTAADQNSSVSEATPKGKK